MIWLKQCLTAGGLLAALLTFGVAVSASEKPKQRASRTNADARKLPGVWLAEAADRDGQSLLSWVWSSRLTLTGDSFALSKFVDMSKDVTGGFTLDPVASPKHIDLRVDPFDLSEAGAPFNIPACTLPGIYRFDGDRLTICFPTYGQLKRPTGFGAKDRNTVVVTLARAGAGFKAFPEHVTLTVNGPDDKPAAGATVFRGMSLQENKKDKEAKSEWQYYEPIKTGADGTAKVAYERLRSYAAAARDPARKLIGFAPVSPASLQKGTATIGLKPECRLTGTIVCTELKKAGKPLGWTNVYLIWNGRRLASCESTTGKFEFPVPPGTYTLHAYGSDLRGKHVTVTVPAGRSETTVPIALTASKRVLLQGQPAPELESVVGWKGEKVKLADLRGKYVLLDFWGYWCGPCVYSMPVLFELHKKFKDRGLAIVGVHLDIDGEVDSAAKLDEKVAAFKKTLWKGEDLPFPVALTSGKLIEDSAGDAVHGGAAAQYGILSYPTTILIDREGKVVGEFAFRDAKQAVAAVEKLLKAKQ